MAEFLLLGKSWLNVDKIVRAENHGTQAEPILTVYYFGGEKVPVDGEDAKRLMTYLNSHPIRKQ